MKKILAVLALSAFSSVVFAQDTTIANATNESNAASGSTSGAEAQGGSAVAGPSTSSVTVTFPEQPGTVTQNVNYSGGTTSDNNVRYSGSFKTVPNVYAPPVGVTAPCIVGWSAGISVIGVGVSAGNGVEDKECTNRENARMLHAFGEVKGAVSLLCQNKNVLKAMPERCGLAQANEGPTPPVVTPVPTTEPVKDCDRKCRRTHKKVTE